MSQMHPLQSKVKAVPYQELVRMTPTLLSPLAALAALMACWRFGADAGWTDAFFLTDGFLFHWQAWLALAIGIQWMAVRLDRVVRHRPSA